MMKEFIGRGQDLVHLLRTSYQGLTNKDDDWLNRNGYTLDTDPNITNEEHRVYTRDGKLAVIVHRGTKTWKDVGTDTLIALGLDKLSPRFHEARRVTRDVRKKYPDYKIYGMGHSLGGALAEQSGADKVITYNKAARLPTFSDLVAEAVGLRRTGRSQTDIRDKQDLISLFSFTHGSKKIKFNNKTNDIIESHSLKNLEKALKKNKLGELNETRNLQDHNAMASEDLPLQDVGHPSIANISPLV